MGLGGAALKLIQTFLYALAFCCAAIVLGIYSYFLAVQADRDVNIPKWQEAVEGLSGSAVVYTIFAVILTCCLGGISFFAFLGIVLDILFCGAFIALAVLTRDGANSCSGDVKSPLGNGPASSKQGFGDFGVGRNRNITYSCTLGTACKLNTACFAVSIIGAIIFAIAALVQLWLGRHHHREKRFGPSPANNYTSGSGSKWFGRKRRTARTTDAAYAKDAEAGAVGAGGLSATRDVDMRPSHDTAYTGTTAGHDATYTGSKYESAPSHIPTAGGYSTAPGGANPYGYETGRTAAATNY